jgi:hypothetical protein
MSVALPTILSNTLSTNPPPNIAFKNQFIFHKKRVEKLPLSTINQSNIKQFNSKMMITAVSVALQRKYKSKIF